jgi:hypothetical protein
MELIGRFLASRLTVRIFAHCVFIVFVAVGSPSNASPDNLIEVSILGRTILIPQPTQFFEGSGVTPYLRRLTDQQMDKAGLSVLAILMPEESREQAEQAKLDDKFFSPDRLAIITRLKAQSAPASEEQCSQELNSFRSEHTELFSKAMRNPRWSKTIIETQDIFNTETPNIQINIGEIIPRGVLGQGSSFVSVGLLMSGSGQILGEGAEEGDTPLLLEMSVNLLCIEERVLAIYVYAKRINQDDLNWLRSFTLNWMNDIERNSMKN